MIKYKNIDDLIIYLQQLQKQTRFNGDNLMINGRLITDFEEVIKANNQLSVIEIGRFR